LNFLRTNSCDRHVGSEFCGYRWRQQCYSLSRWVCRWSQQVSALVVSGRSVAGWLTRLLICLRRHKWQIFQVHCKWIYQAPKFRESVNYIFGWYQNIARCVRSQLEREREEKKKLGNGRRRTDVQNGTNAAEQPWNGLSESEKKFPTHHSHHLRQGQTGCFWMKAPPAQESGICVLLPVSIFYLFFGSILRDRLNGCSYDQAAVGQGFRV
jgi:hypothetical protein